MTLHLTTEQSLALNASGDEMQILDPKSNKLYVVVEQSVHEKAKAALRLQEEENLSSIAAGIADLESGKTTPFEVAHDRIREKLINRYNP